MQQRENLKTTVCRALHTSQSQQAWKAGAEKTIPLEPKAAKATQATDATHAKWYSSAVEESRKYNVIEGKVDALAINQLHSRVNTFVASKSIFLSYCLQQKQITERQRSQCMQMQHKTATCLAISGLSHKDIQSSFQQYFIKYISADADNTIMFGQVLAMANTDRLNRDATSLKHIRECVKLGAIKFRYKNADEEDCVIEVCNQIEPAMIAGKNLKDDLHADLHCNGNNRNVGNNRNACNAGGANASAGYVLAKNRSICFCTNQQFNNILIAVYGNQMVAFANGEGDCDISKMKKRTNQYKMLQRFAGLTMLAFTYVILARFSIASSVFFGMFALKTICFGHGLAMHFNVKYKKISSLFLKVAKRIIIASTGVEVFKAMFGGQIHIGNVGKPKERVLHGISIQHSANGKVFSVEEKKSKFNFNFIQERNSANEDTFIKPTHHMMQRMPKITILAALYDEEVTVPQLVEAISRLQYNTNLLEVFLAIEEGDDVCKNAIDKIDLPSHFSVITVPNYGRKTKPKALNYAASMASGELICIYDAEDIPDEDQLIKAVKAFETNGEKCAALQGVLKPYNHKESFIARMFSIEYAFWFNFGFRGASSFGLFLPLGGTTNICRTKCLEEVGFWDSANVVEDLQLSIDFHDLGYNVAFFNSVTQEEAPTKFMQWLKQRTRWQKGYIISYMSRGLDSFKSFKFFAGMEVFVSLSIFSPILYFATVSKVIIDAYNGVANQSMIAMYVLIGVVSIFITAISSRQILKRTPTQSVLDGFLFLIYFAFQWISVVRSVFYALVSPAQWEKTPHNTTMLPLNKDAEEMEK